MRVTEVATRTVETILHAKIRPMIVSPVQPLVTDHLRRIPEIIIPCNRALSITRRGPPQVSALRRVSVPTRLPRRLPPIFPPATNEPVIAGLPTPSDTTCCSLPLRPRGRVAFSLGPVMVPIKSAPVVPRRRSTARRNHVLIQRSTRLKILIKALALVEVVCIVGAALPRTARSLLGRCRTMYGHTKGLAVALEDQLDSRALGTNDIPFDFIAWHAVARHIIDPQEEITQLDARGG